MSEPRQTWHASPAAGVMVAKLFELYARALRVRHEQERRRVAKLVALVGGTKQQASR